MPTAVVQAALMTDFNNRVTDVIGCINSAYGMNTYHQVYHTAQNVCIFSGLPEIIKRKR